MQDDTVYRAMLFDFYGELLTEKQREYFELHYGDDLSLGEIAAMSGVSRQAVWDNIRRAESYLNDIEAKLGLVKRYEHQRDAIAAVSAELAPLLQSTDASVRESAKRIGERIDSIEF